MEYRSRAPSHDHAAVRTLRERRDGALDLAGIAHIGHAQVHAEGGRRSLDDAEHARSGRDGRLSKDRSPRHVGGNLFEQFQPFRSSAVFEQDKTGGMAARLRQAVDVAGADGSTTLVNTIGTVRVACSDGARAALEFVRMTSGASANNSAAYLRIRSASATPQRVSMRTLRPSSQPNCASPCTNAVMRA